MNSSVLSSVESAIAAVKAGKMVIIVDDEDRENEGDLVMAADFATPAAINFMATHGRGLICLSMQGSMLDRLHVPMMVPNQQNSSGFGTGFTISVEAASGVTTGISAEDRAHTIKTMINPGSTANHLAMPGHIFPIRAKDGGVFERRGQTEASVDLSKLAGLTPAGVICEVMREDGTMMRLNELTGFAKEHDMPIISVEQLVEFRQQLEADSTAGHIGDASADAAIVVEVGRSKLPTEHGHFDVVVFRDRQGLEHSVLIKGDLNDSAPLVRLHSECLTGDAFGSLRCDCGPQLKASMHMIDSAGCGAILYLRQEGRGIGLGNKIRAYALQDQGRDTVDANHELGFPADARTYDVAAAMLRSLGINQLRLLSNNPDKHKSLKALGITVDEAVPLIIPAQEHNADYLKTKADRMGHTLDSDATGSTTPMGFGTANVSQTINY